MPSDASTDVRAHLNCDDSRLIEGRCSECGKVRYSTTTAAACHQAGSWMRESNPKYTPRYRRTGTDHGGDDT